MSIPVSDIMPSPTYVAGRRWIGEHIDEVAAQYPNQWVGIYEDHVVSANPDLSKAEDDVPATIPLADVIFRFVDDGTLVFVAGSGAL